MYMSIMHSENYEWIGFGETKKEAERAIEKKWNSSTRETMTVEELDEYYCIFTIEVVAGKCRVFS